MTAPTPPSAPHRARAPRTAAVRIARVRIVVAGALLALGLGACGGSSSTTSVSPPASTVPGGVAVSIANFAFSPPTLHVRVGTTVTWTNHDGVVHNIVWHAGGLPSSANLTPGSTEDSYSHTFSSVGTFPYTCGIHPVMAGTVVVSP